MPTGNTAPVLDGEVTELRDYLLIIGKNFGAFITQREESGPAKLLAETESYYVKRLSELNAELDALLFMTDGEAVEACREDFKCQMTSHEKRIAEDQRTRDRYNSMIEKVEAWEPAEGQESVKEYALAQLRESLDFDTFKNIDDYKPQPVEDVAEWHGERVASVRQSLVRATQHLADDEKRDRERRDWSDKFFASLPKESVHA